MITSSKVLRYFVSAESVGQVTEPYFLGVRSTMPPQSKQSGYPDRLRVTFLKTESNWQSKLVLGEVNLVAGFAKNSGAE